jgi:hypothetical protein
MLKIVSKVAVLFVVLFSSFAESSQLDFVINPEIKYDPFYYQIKEITSKSNLRNILEIGSSSGEGSTEAFVLGIELNPVRPQLFCMELSKPRFHQLSKHYRHLDFVHCYNLSSISLDEFPRWEAVEYFLKHTDTPLANVGYKEVQRWYNQDVDYMKKHGAIENGIQKIKLENKIDQFDMVLIDGSEFTGVVELPYIYGAGYILLDDINTFKNYQNFEILKKDPHYELITFDKKVRNGYAIFKRKDF